jgi:mycothiol synthase
MVIEGIPDDDPDLPRPTWPGLVVTSRLTDSDLVDLAALVADATAADGVAPLSEHALLHLRTDAGRDARHLLVRGPASSGDSTGSAGSAGSTVADGSTDAAGAAGSAGSAGGAGSAGPTAELLAVAHVDLGSATDHATAEIVVRPDQRRGGLGSALLKAAAELAGPTPLRVWAHGDLPASQGFARAHGYERVRELWQMSRPLTDPLPSSPLPDGFTLRAFRPGQDDDAWLAINAAAFAHHAEQGAWQVADLQQRMAEPWFDPAGFLLLADDATGELAGFHWTKVHPAEQPVGEVYVVGVAPGYQGRGLAKPLTLAGLQHLRGRGLARVMLYVDGDNDAAVRTYSGLGFTRAALDVQYARP